MYITELLVFRLLELQSLMLANKYLRRSKPRRTSATLCFTLRMRSTSMSNRRVRKLSNGLSQFYMKLFYLGDRDASYDEFLEKLKIVNGAEKECRYGLFDFEYTHQCQGTQEVMSARCLQDWLACDENVLPGKEGKALSHVLVPRWC